MDTKAFALIRVGPRVTDLFFKGVFVIDRAERKVAGEGNRTVPVLGQELH